MQITLFNDDRSPVKREVAPKKKAHKSKKRPKQPARAHRRKRPPILPSGWRPPLPVARSGWIARWLAHYQPSFAPDDAWASPIGESGPVVPDDLMRLAGLEAWS